MLISFFWICIPLLCDARAGVVRKYSEPPCDPLKNVYYAAQANICLPCETCPIGYGKLTLQESKINLDSVNGPKECLECRPCKNNTYSDTQSYHCKPCTVCSTSGQYETSPCKHTQDTVCSKYRPSKKEDPIKDVTAKPGERTKTKENTKPGVVFLTVLSVIAVAIVIVAGSVYVHKQGNICSRLRSGIRSLNGNETATQNSLPCSGIQIQTYGSTPSIDNSAFEEVVGANGTNDGVDDSSDDECKPLLSGHRRPICGRRTRHLSHTVTQEASNDVPILKARKRSNSLSVLVDISKKPHPLLRQQLSFDSPAQIYLTQDRYAFLQEFNSKMAEKVKEWDGAHSKQWQNPISKQYLTSSEFINKCSVVKTNTDLIPLLERIRKWEENEAGLGGRCMVYLSKQLSPGYKFRDLARHLDLSNVDIDIILQDYKGDCTEQSYRVLEKLKRTSKIKTKDDIIQALKQLKEFKLVKKISSELYSN